MTQLLAQPERKARLERLEAAGIELPRRDTAMRLHRKQARLWKSDTRFRVAPCGRRSGKTELFKRFIRKAALSAYRYPDSRYIAAGPTQQQAKRIFWGDLKKLVPTVFRACEPSETELTIRLVNGAELMVAGLDRPERIEGVPIDGIGIDEFPNVKPEAWTEHIRPMLTERNGWAWLFGVPEGRNHYYTIYEQALEDDSGEWEVFEWTSEEVLPLYLGAEVAALEIAQAKRDMDEKTYKQEFLASFESFEGRAYYNFSRAIHASMKQTYDPGRPLHIALDFNVSPGVAAIIQERGSTVSVIDEVWIERDSNSLLITDEVCRRYGDVHEREVYVYGDATGGAGGTAKVVGSDTVLVESNLRRTFGRRVKMRFLSSNPRVRVRLNAVNSKLRAMDGTVGVQVDPHCTHFIRDLDGVMLKKDGSGDIDKDAKKFKFLTHISDGFGYYIAQRFPVSSSRPGVVIR